MAKGSKGGPARGKEEAGKAEGSKSPEKENPKVPEPEEPEAEALPFVSATSAMAFKVVLVSFALYQAYNIRLFAIEEYGLVIHEFDPWFNFRATKYLLENGMDKFFTWFDYESWYPLGRPVGSTIYPGMQMVAVAIYHLLETIGTPMSINDVCCYIPAWGGVTATIFLGLLTWECTNNSSYAAVATAIMSIVPAHIMRSVGGGYDNESVAMTAMMMTFYFWVRSLRSSSSVLWGVVAGLAYTFMVATWGGYVFVLNMIGIHAAVLMIANAVFDRDHSKLHRAFSLFYIVGTLGAIQVPVVGMAPLKSFEQLPTFFVFLGVQVLEVCEIIRKKQNMTREQSDQLRLKVIGAGALLVVFGIIAIMPTGYFGPISSRVRGLFVKHTKTGNPLVDSVAEHQPASAKAYQQNLHNVYYLAPIGFGVLCTKKSVSRDSSVFLILYALVAYYFSSKMSRLIILLGPIASVLGGISIVWLFHWSLRQLKPVVASLKGPELSKEDKLAKKKAEREEAANRKQRRKDKELTVKDQWNEVYEEASVKSLRKGLAGMYLLSLLYFIPSFSNYCHSMAKAMSHPSLMFKAQLKDGTVIMVDDYREAYWWLRDKTPKDSRVMAWWDYGYQITGIAERTSIADGNTWNHEHIATLGRCLVSPEKKAHKMIRHLADYMLVWTGGGGDDLAKSPHIARIANSVYNDVCGVKDPLCRKFGFNEYGPTAMMEKSLLYKLHSHEQKPGVEVNEKLFKHVFTSKYNKVRIYKVMDVDEDSKAWVANPDNRNCDRPGSWYCPQGYPPNFRFVLKDRKDFKQLEDFNVGEDEDAKQYQEEYFKNLKAGRG